MLLIQEWPMLFWPIALRCSGFTRQYFQLLYTPSLDLPPLHLKVKSRSLQRVILAVLLGVRKLYDMNFLAGTNALMCMLTGSLVLHYKSKSESSNNITGDNDEAIVPAIVASLCLLAGAWQVLLAALQFPRLSWLLSGK